MPGAIVFPLIVLVRLRPPAAQAAGTEPAPIVAKRACVSLDRIDNSHSPVDLYASVANCSENNRDADAIGLFMLAGMDSRFDSIPVTDKTAGQARQILIMSLFDGMPAEQRTRFQGAIKALMDQPPDRAALCARIRQIGPPTTSVRTW